MEHRLAAFSTGATAWCVNLAWTATFMLCNLGSDVSNYLSSWLALLFVAALSQPQQRPQNKSCLVANPEVCWKTTLRRHWSH